MDRHSTVDTDDLGAALDYLEGLLVLLDALDKGEVTPVDEAALTNRLQAIDGYTVTPWEPLRYQSADGQGWTYVASGVRDVRERLLGPYTEAAL